MLSGDIESIGGRVLGALDNGIGNLITKQAEIGSNYVRAQEAIAKAQTNQLGATNLIAREGDLDFTKAVTDTLEAAVKVFCEEDLQLAKKVEPLEETIDYLSEEMKKRHIKRLRKGKCTIEMGFVLSDITTKGGKSGERVRKTNGVRIRKSGCHVFPM